MSQLPPLDWNKLAKILTRLESDQPGEVLNAAKAACAMVQRSGLTWEQVLDPQEEKITMTQDMWAAGLKRYSYRRGFSKGSVQPEQFAQGFSQKQKRQDTFASKGGSADLKSSERPFIMETFVFSGKLKG